MCWSTPFQAQGGVVLLPKSGRCIGQGGEDAEIQPDLHLYEVNRHPEGNSGQQPHQAHQGPFDHKQEGNLARLPTQGAQQRRLARALVDRMSSRLRLPMATTSSMILAKISMPCVMVFDRALQFGEAGLPERIRISGRYGALGGDNLRLWPICLRIMIASVACRAGHRDPAPRPSDMLDGALFNIRHAKRRRCRPRSSCRPRILLVGERPTRVKRFRPPGYSWPRPARCR